MSKPTYSCTDGTRLTTSQIDTRVTLAKGILLDNQLQEHGYNFCTECERNDCKPLDCAHIISVKEAKETGRAELCWDINNMKIIGRCHHQKQDGLNLQWNGKS